MQLVFLDNSIDYFHLWPARCKVTSYAGWWIANYYYSERTENIRLSSVTIQYSLYSFTTCWPTSYIFHTLQTWQQRTDLEWETFERHLTFYRLTVPETSTRCRKLDPPCPPVPREATQTLCPLTSWTLPWVSRPGVSSSPCMPWGDNRPGLSYRAGECQYYCWLAGNVDCNYCSE